MGYELEDPINRAEIDMEHSVLDKKSRKSAYLNIK
jgi:hypothetical protein